MEILLKELLKLIEDEIEIFRSLLPIFKKEKEAVLASDLNELKRTLAKKEKLLFNMRSLEKKRTHVMNKLAESLELSPDELTLKKLAQSVQKPYSIRLKSCGLQMSKLINSISNANNANRGMFAHSNIDHIRVAGGNCDCAYGTGTKISVGNIFPILPGICRSSENNGYHRFLKKFAGIYP